MADVFAFQDRITADVAMIVGPQIQVAEIELYREMMKIAGIEPE